MDPLHIWGPRIWRTLHEASASYPENPSAAEKEEARHAIIGIPALIPCASCKSHIRREILSLPLSVSEAVMSRQSFFWYVWAIHDMVNQRLGKRHVSFTEAKKKYGI